MKLLHKSGVYVEKKIFKIEIKQFHILDISLNIEMKNTENLFFSMKKIQNLENPDCHLLTDATLCHFVFLL